MYDLRCEVLARVFVGSNPNISNLSQAIQDAIEAWLSENEPDFTPAEVEKIAAGIAAEDAKDEDLPW